MFGSIKSMFGFVENMFGLVKWEYVWFVWKYNWFGFKYVNLVLHIFGFDLSKFSLEYVWFG